MALHPCGVCGRPVHLQIIRFRSPMIKLVSIWVMHKEKLPKCYGADAFAVNYGVKRGDEGPCPKERAEALVAEWNGENPA